MRVDHNAIILLTVLAFACTSGTLSDAGITAVTGDATYDSSDAMRFEIEQTSSPMTFRGNSGVDVCFRMTITNATKEPMRIKRILLQSLGGGSYRLETSSRKFDKAIKPGDKESFRYWAPAIASDPGLGTSGPLVVRTTVDARAGSGPIRAVFNRRVNGEVAVVVGSGH